MQLVDQLKNETPKPPVRKTRGGFIFIPLIVVAALVIVGVIAATSAYWSHKKATQVQSLTQQLMELKNEIRLTATPGPSSLPVTPSLSPLAIPTVLPVSNTVHSVKPKHTSQPVVMPTILKSLLPSITHVPVSVDVPTFSPSPTPDYSLLTAAVEREKSSFDSYQQARRDCDQIILNPIPDSLRGYSPETQQSYVNGLERPCLSNALTTLDSLIVTLQTGLSLPNQPPQFTSTFQVVLNRMLLERSRLRDQMLFNN